MIVIKALLVILMCVLAILAGLYAGDENFFKNLKRD